MYKQLYYHTIDLLILLSSLRKDAKWLRTQREISFYSKEDSDRAIATAQEFFSLLEGFP